MPTIADLAEDFDEAEAEAEAGPFTFSALSKKAQQHALDKARYRDVEFDDWWGSVYEDAARMAALLGIDIDTFDKNSGRSGPTIYFTGFCSQGDGASFVGWYRPKADALTAIKAETDDKTLINIAERLTVLNVTLALWPEFERLQAKVTTSGHYSHSRTMNITVEYEPCDVNMPDVFPGISVEDELTACMREFADWIYNQLEAEHDYLTSDKTVQERLTDGALSSTKTAI